MFLPLAQQMSQLKLKSVRNATLFIPGKKRLLIQWAKFRNSKRGWREKKYQRKRKRGNMPDIESVKKEYETLLQQLGNPELISDWERFEGLTKKKKYLEKMIDKDKEIIEIGSKIEENKSIISSGEEPELTSLAEAEITQLKERGETLKKELESLLSDTNTENKKEAKAAIIEIRAGTGGEEAALFAADLFRMYSRYGQSQNWKQQILDSRPTGIGGLKEIIFELSGPDVFSKMKHEGGVHRTQRIPETEKAGRIHTSTASVAVLAKAKKEEIKRRTDDLCMSD